MSEQPSESTEPSQPPSPHAQGEEAGSTTRIFVLLFAAMHLLAAAGIWWLMPGGFPIDHPRFWANRVLPAMVLLYAVAIVILASRKHWRVLTAMLLASPMTWIGAAIGGMTTFPISGRKPAVVAMVAAITFLFAIR